MMKPTWGRCLAVFALLLALPASSLACTVSAAGLAFGGYSPFDSYPTESTATITVDCEDAYTLSLDPGLHGSYNPRQMARDADPADRLDYNLYTGPDFSIVWGDGSEGTQVILGDGSSVPVNHTVHGRIPAGQNARVGSYGDLITVTLEF